MPRGSKETAMRKRIILILAGLIMAAGVTFLPGCEVTR